MVRRARHRRWAAILLIGITLVVLIALVLGLNARHRQEWAKRTSSERLNEMGGQLAIGNRRGDWLVSLDDTRTDDAALAKLVASLKYCPVDDLSLRNTRITNDGLRSVAQLRGLGSLDISGTQVTDEGLQHLTSVKSLWRIIRKNTRITDRGLAELRESLPGVDAFERLNELEKPPQ